MSRELNFGEMRPINTENTSPVSIINELHGIRQTLDDILKEMKRHDERSERALGLLITVGIPVLRTIERNSIIEEVNDAVSDEEEDDSDDIFDDDWDKFQKTKHQTPRA